MVLSSESLWREAWGDVEWKFTGRNLSHKEICAQQHLRLDRAHRLEEGFERSDGFLLKNNLPLEAAPPCYIPSP